MEAKNNSKLAGQMYIDFSAGEQLEAEKQEILKKYGLDTLEKQSRINFVDGKWCYSDSYVKNIPVEEYFREEERPKNWFDR